MAINRITKKVVQLFPATLLRDQKPWGNAIPLLPTKTCLLVTNAKTQKQTQLMRNVAQTFRNQGWQVLIWMPPKSPSSPKITYVKN
jgi:hypothetical protein